MSIVTPYIPREYLALRINYCKQQLEELPEVLRYADRPGVVAAIGQALSLAGINIENIVAPTDHKSGDSLAVIKTNMPVSDDQVLGIAKTISAKLAFTISM